MGGLSHFGTYTRLLAGCIHPFSAVLVEDVTTHPSSPYIVRFTADICEAIRQLFVDKMLTKYCHCTLKRMGIAFFTVDSGKS